MELSKKEQAFRRKILTDEEVRALAKATKAMLGSEIMAASNKYDLSIEDGLRYMSLAARLEDARTARALTLKEAAAELKTPKYRLEDVEKGHLSGLKPGLLVQYVDYLGLKAWFSKWKKANVEFSERLGLSSGAGKTAGGESASIPALVKTLAEKKIDAILKKRLPPWAKDQIRLSFKFRGNTATIFEHRAPWMQGDTEWSVMSAAQLRYNVKSGRWTLYCADRNSRWHEYTNVPSAKDLDGLLEEIDRDPTGIFWG
jgi:hypothetical protein